MQKLSQDTVKYLTRTGWTPGRLVEVDQYENALRQAGFVVHQAALDFLRQFGGLRVHYPHPKVADMEDEMHFDPLITIRHIRPADVAAYGKHVGKQLSIIGEAARGYLVLMMDEDGRVYASYDDYFGIVGNSGIEAIEALCSGQEIENIPLPDGWDQL